MVIEKEPVHEFLAAMETVREALGDFLRALYRRPEVKFANLFHPSAYVSSDFGVSVELKNGATVDFWIDLKAKGELWELTYYVARHDLDEDGNHTEADFPSRNIASGLELPPAILAAVNELRRTSENDALFR
jgi:hypothetical protein